MKLALITDPYGFEIIERHHLGYHLVLAQHCQDKRYISFYKECALRGHHIILDNGAAELGTSMVFSEVVHIANVIGADEIAMPDTLMDYEKTILATHDACFHVPVSKRMLIPQGKDWEDWGKCLVELADLGGRSIGIPKLLDTYPGGRDMALDMIQGFGIQNSFDIHLLGCVSNPLDEIAHLRERYPWIRGVDSAAPFAWAQNGRWLRDGGHHSYTWGDEFSKPIADTNVGVLLGTCGGI